MTSNPQVTPVCRAKRFGWLLFFTVLSCGLLNATAFAIVVDPIRVPSGITGEFCEKLRGQDITLDIAKRVQARAALSKRVPQLKVHLTREGDYPVSWQERVAQANERSDLFIALHFESSPTPQAAGLRLYSLQPDLTLATSRQRDPIIEAQKPRSMSSVALKHAAETDRLLTELEISFAKNLNSRAYVLRDMFLPLMGVDAPAVMVGLGFLSNAEDCQKLADEAYRNRLAAALLDAAGQYKLQTRANLR